MHTNIKKNYHVSPTMYNVQVKKNFKSFWTTKELKLQHIFTYNSHPSPSQYFYSNLHLQHLMTTTFCGNISISDQRKLPKLGAQITATCRKLLLFFVLFSYINYKYNYLHI